MSVDISSLATIAAESPPCRLQVANVTQRSSKRPCLPYPSSACIIMCELWSLSCALSASVAPDTRADERCARSTEEDADAGQ